MPPLYVKENIWKYYDEDKVPIIITTNIGWKKNDENVMGAGIVKQAAKRFPDLSRWYGQKCQTYGEFTPVLFTQNYDIPLILMPTKALNKEQPHLSWQAKSDIQLICSGLEQLISIYHRFNFSYFAMTYPGCGNGGLLKKDIKPILDHYLSFQFCICEI